MLFGCKHESPEVMDLSLLCLQDLVTKMGSQGVICTQFYSSFYVLIMTELLSVMTDCRHLAGFKLHVSILKELILLVDQEKIGAPINVNG